MEVAELIRNAREEAGLSVRVLANAAGVSPNTVHLIEKGDTNPTIETIQELLYATGARLTLEAKPDYGTNVIGLIRSIQDDQDIEKNDTTWIIRKTAFFVSRTLRKPRIERLRLLLLEPPSTGSGNWDAFIAGVVEWIMHQSDIDVEGSWVTNKKYYLNHGWWITDFESLKPWVYANTPMSLKIRGVYVDRESLINR
ncbi:MAG TPA: helix-turn-helix domain-containing protein [Acidimicrobiia bacterium]|nr:helix-turn-helix domain-containing protein [Acidimicrobiia bacterium]